MPDTDHGVRWYEKACELGEAAACDNLGRLWRDGIDGTIDQEQERGAKALLVFGLSNPFGHR